MDGWLASSHQKWMNKVRKLQKRAIGHWVIIVSQPVFKAETLYSSLLIWLCLIQTIKGLENQLNLYTKKSGSFVITNCFGCIFPISSNELDVFFVVSIFGGSLRVIGHYILDIYFILICRKMGFSIKFIGEISVNGKAVNYAPKNIVSNFKEIIGINI